MDKTSLIRTGITLFLTPALSLALLGPSLLSPSAAEASGGDLTAQEPLAVETTSSGVAGLTSGHTYVVYSALKSTAALEVAGESKSSGANVRLWRFTREKGQQWVVKIGSNGKATFKSILSGKYLDVANGSAKSGANVDQYKGNGSKAQKWKITRNSNGTYRIASTLGKKLSLAVAGGSAKNGANVQLAKTKGAKAQQWKFFDVNKMRADIAKKAKKNKGSVSAGTYVIYSKVASKKVIDINAASTKSGANAQLYEYNGTTAQKFTVSYDSTGYAYIKNSSGKYLTVDSSVPLNSTNVVQKSKNGSLAQRWIIVKRSDGTFRISSALWNDVSLDVAGGSSKNGANVQIYKSNSTNAQKWRFVSSSAGDSSVALGLTGKSKKSFKGISFSGAKAAGIDVSVWNGSINWNKVAASGIKFAIIRCGYGSDDSSQDDKRFLENVQGARAAGLKIGVYLYSYATDTSMAKSEAKHTLRLLDEAGLTPGKVKYGVYYDVEDGSQADANLAKICKKYCGMIEEAGYSVGVYSYLNWWNDKLTNSCFDGWRRWVAQWPAKTGGQTCQYTGKYKIWQCMSDGAVPGIVGRVDMNLAY